MEGTMMQGLSIINKGRGAPAVRLGMEIERIRFALYCGALSSTAFFFKVQRPLSACKSPPLGWVFTE